MMMMMMMMPVKKSVEHLNDKLLATQNNDQIVDIRSLQHGTESISRLNIQLHKHGGMRSRQRTLKTLTIANPENTDQSVICDTNALFKLKSSDAENDLNMEMTPAQDLK